MNSDNSPRYANAPTAHAPTLTLDSNWRSSLEATLPGADFALEGRHVAVTHAMSTIGRTQAVMLTLAGARVTLLDAPTLLADGKDLMRELPTSRFFGVDCNQMVDAQRAASHLASDDPVDVLINNVAPDIKFPFRQLSVDDFELQIHASCTAGFVMSRAVAEGMKKRGRGSIVNLCAATLQGEWNGYVSYAASNGAIVGLTRSLARELGGHGIRVNAISIGAVASRAEVRIFGERLAEYDAWVIQNQCIKRRVLPEDVGNLVLFLASERSSIITGQNFIIDGGW